MRESRLRIIRITYLLAEARQLGRSKTKAYRVLVAERRELVYEIRRQVSRKKVAA